MSVEKVIEHPDYIQHINGTEDFTDYDFAILRLKDKINFSEVNFNYLSLKNIFNFSK